MLDVYIVSPFFNSINFYELNLDKMYRIFVFLFYWWQNHAEDYEFSFFASKGSYFVWSSNSKYRLDILFIVQ